MDDSVRLIVTASAAEVPASLAASPRLHFVGRRSVAQMEDLWARCRAVYFPDGSRVVRLPASGGAGQRTAGHRRDTAQNREIAGPALCGYAPGDRDALRQRDRTRR